MKRKTWIEILEIGFLTKWWGKGKLGGKEPLSVAASLCSNDPILV